jgi:DMSO/TMAO reductase YedYZ molybdopterin-dependent catalytic subunit
LLVRGPAGEGSLADLQTMPQVRARLPIACVEGWSAQGNWEGVRVRDVAGLVGAPVGADVRFVSLQRGGSYGTSVLPAAHVRDELSLLALRLNGGPLELDHGYPCRLIAASRPGVLQTKWLIRIEVLA